MCEAWVGSPTTPQGLGWAWGVIGGHSGATWPLAPLSAISCRPLAGTKWAAAPPKLATPHFWAPQAPQWRALPGCHPHGAWLCPHRLGTGLGAKLAMNFVLKNLHFHIWQLAASLQEPTQRAKGFPKHPRAHSWPSHGVCTHHHTHGAPPHPICPSWASFQFYGGGYKPKLAQQAACGGNKPPSKCSEACVKHGWAAPPPPKA